MSRIFADREDAGRQLAAKLVHFKQEHPVVLAIPRGGVPVGFEISKALGAELDIILVRKIGAPYQPELAVGAVVDGERPETVWNREIVEALELSEEFLKEETARALKEIERRRKAYIGTRTRPTIGGRTAIVVDDGIATGATVRAALIAIRRSAPKRLVLAVPVAPPETVESLRREVDELVCLETPDVFWGISQFYVDFPQLTDPQVTSLLGDGLQRTEDSKAGSGP
ncbi:MAG: phosphoribosyltransferase [Gemmatimonadales bacterium]